MSNWEELFESLFKISVWTVAKGVVILVLFLYLAFALVVVRQVEMMTRVVSGNLNFPLKVFSWLHLFFSLGVIFLAFFLL